MWHYRELLFFLTWRDILIRYKQTALGGQGCNQCAVTNA